MDIVKKQTEGILVRKVDLISYANPSLEKMVTRWYLKWIRYAPETYDLVYKKFFYTKSSTDHSFKWEQSVQSFQKDIEMEGEADIADFFSGILEQKSLKPTGQVEQSKVYHLARA